MIDVDSLDGAEQPLEIIIEGHGGTSLEDMPITCHMQLVPEVAPGGVTLDVSAVYIQGQEKAFTELRGRYVDEYAVSHIVKTPDLDRPSLHVNLVPVGEADSITVLDAESWDEVQEAFEE